MGNLLLELLINGCIAVGIAFVPFVATILINKKFRSRVSNFCKKHLKNRSCRTDNCVKFVKINIII